MALFIYLLNALTCISLKFLLAQTLISFVAWHLCVRMNLIYQINLFDLSLKQNKQSFYLHILVVIASICLLNGQIYLMFHETRQVGRKWHYQLYVEKKSILHMRSQQSQNLNQIFCLFDCEDTSLMLSGCPGSTCEVLWGSRLHCLSLNVTVRYRIWLHNIGGRVGPKECVHIIQINVLIQMWQLVRSQNTCCLTTRISLSFYLFFCKTFCRRAVLNV